MAWWQLSIVALVACSSGPKASTTPGGGDAEGSAAGCEPGRCLADIAAKISERKPEARACYDALSTSKVKGRLIINFRIDAEGNVTETSQGMQDDQITDETLVTCVSDVIKSVKFAASAKGKNTRAYHQFEFSPRSGR
jgi:hypothetical protein